MKRVDKINNIKDCKMHISSLYKKVVPVGHRTNRALRKIEILEARIKHLERVSPRKDNVSQFIKPSEMRPYLDRYILQMSDDDRRNVVFISLVVFVLCSIIGFSIGIILGMM